MSDIDKSVVKHALQFQKQMNIGRPTKAVRLFGTSFVCGKFVKMQRLTGKHEYSVKYFFDGYLYYRDNRSSGTILRCVKKNVIGCRARIYFDNVESILRNEQIIVREAHIHEKDDLFPLRYRFTEELKELSRSTFEELKKIYDVTKSKDE